MPRQILHVDLDAFFASVEQALDPSLANKAVIVGGDPTTRGVVASASYEARRHGVHSAMPLSNAYRLCPHAVFLPTRFELYRGYSRQFMDILEQFTPDIESGGLDEAYLDLTGFEPIYGPTEATGLRIKKRIKEELGLTASVGIATSKAVAKVASDCCKPDGIHVVPRGREKAFLSPLPVRDLPCVGERAEQLLGEMGITTVGALALTRPIVLRARLGLLGETVHQFANGIDPRPVVPYFEAKSISRETTFIEDVSALELIRSTLQYLEERVGLELRAQGKKAKKVFVKLRFQDFETITRQATLKEPTDDDRVIYHTGLRLWRRAARDKPKKLRLVGIGVGNLVTGGIQSSLLAPDHWKDSQLARTKDFLRRKYGFGALESGLTLFLREALRQGVSGGVLKRAVIE